MTPAGEPPAETSPDPERSLLDVAESPRVGDWSLRSALVRLAQPEPVRAGAVLEIARRCQAALGHGEPVPEPLTAVLVELDALADELAGWADDPRQAAPITAVDDICGRLAQRLDELGVPRERAPEERAAGERPWSNRRGGERSPGRRPRP